ncbi:BREX system serine/threonine kinase PglW [Cellulomonas humilata]|uniref:non-specific serine/threonine protein kinase n=2 Tax=Cellulomonas humilata TaxID=144055 RepID=A0A7Y6DYI1_9CELL|nr:BREX system serine/threonine kinase PglW [Cellulomonas humilata]
MTQWESLGDPASPAEAEALERLRAVVCAGPVARGWTNVTFVDLNGRTAELDAVIVTRVGVFVVELKGWSGKIGGTQQSWRVTSGAGTVRTEKNPLWLTELKAKRLKSLLMAKARNAQERSAVPFIGALVVLHAQGSVVDLDDHAGQRILTLDGAGVSWAGDHTLGTFLGTPADDSSRMIDGTQARKVETLMLHAGFAPTPKTRMIGDYSLEKADPLGEGPTWQDLLAMHPHLQGAKRRLRLFDVPPGAGAQQRAEIVIGAEREFTLTDGLNHDGIVSPREFYQTDSGPALLFDYNPKARFLDDWIADHGADLDLDSRLAIIRDIGETLRWAHERRLMHRALTPRQIEVIGEAGAKPHVAIRDWMTGQRVASSRTTQLTIHSQGAADVLNLVDVTSQLYLAPEQLSGRADLPPVPLDVYGFGALAYLVLTGTAPATTFAELEQKLASAGGLDPSAAAPDIPEPFATVVLDATRAIETDRMASVDEVLDALTAAYELVTEPITEPRPEIDPVDALKGAILGERFEVTGRRGSGSTGIALEVTDYDSGQDGLILKVARDERSIARLADEAGVLARLDHPRVVKLVDGPVNIQGRSAILLTDAGAETLAARLEAEGRSTIEQLENYGRDLFEAVAHLDERGVFHRDIKPANLAIGPDRSTRRPRLNLFDLSLAVEPLTNLSSGTADYLDPGLGKGRRRQFDRAAELYAVAVTLFQMAAGAMPWWMSGGSQPQGASDLVGFTESTFEPSVASGLLAFFRSALASDPDGRFGSVDEMARAWQSIFDEIDDRPDDELDAKAREALAAAATLDTTVENAGLSARALSGVRRLGASTIRELLGRSPVEVNSIAGLGERFRKEVQARVREWRGRLLDEDVAALGRISVHDVDASAVEVVVQRLLEARSVAMTRSVKLMVGAAEPGDEAAADALGMWPALADIATVVGLPRSEVAEQVAAAATVWAARKAARPDDDVVALLQQLGGVAALDELTHAVLRTHGSAVSARDRVRRAAGYVRAATEIDAVRPAPRLAVRRVGERVVLATALESGERPAAAAETLLDLAERLAAAADGLVAAGEPVPHVRARSTLRGIGSSGAMEDERLVRLAASASASALLSNSGELYLRTLDWRVAVRAVLAGQGLRTIDVAGIRRRVTARFPSVIDVPGRPQLDSVVESAVPGMRATGDVFTRVESSTGRTGTSTGSSVHRGLVPASQVAAQLVSSLRTKSAVTLCAHPDAYVSTTRMLGRVFPEIRTVDVGAELVRAARADAKVVGASWEFVLGADVEPPTSPLGSDLRVFLEPTVTAVWDRLMADTSPLLLTNAGPLLRYGFTSALAEMLDLATDRPAARWLLVPRPRAVAIPTLDGHAIPLGADRPVDVPLDLESAVSGAHA